MKKSILNLGSELNKEEQKKINGGLPPFCTSHNQCPPNQCCQSDPIYNFGYCGARTNHEGLCNGQISHDDVPF